MNTADDFAVKCKMVERYLKPLLFNLDAIYINAKLVRSNSGQKEWLFIKRQDNEEIIIDVKGKSSPEIVKTVLNELF